MKQLIITLFLACCLLFSCEDDDGTLENVDPPISIEGMMGGEPINEVVSPFKCDGISFTSPRNEFPASHFEAISDMETGWIALIPFAFSEPGEAAVTYDIGWQWWGESQQGIRTLCDYSRQHDLKIMIKPHVWVSRETWIGDFTLNDEETALEWEDNYRAYIMSFASLAEEVGAEIFCVGTELKQISVSRPDYWRGLIAEIREVYSGKLTYAANWDNYNNVTFWDALDFVGVDSYFPLIEKANPSVAELDQAWIPQKEAFRSFSEQVQRPILFTEYGYMSVDYTAWRNWENESNRENLPVNLDAQLNAYQSFFNTYWEEDWFAGGFLWKWYHDHENSGGIDNKDYTVQNKPAENLIRSYFELQ